MPEEKGKHEEATGREIFEVKMVLSTDIYSCDLELVATTINADLDKTLEVVNSVTRRVARNREALEEVRREVSDIDARLAMLRKKLLQDMSVLN